MSSLFLSVLKMAYGAGGVVTFVGFFPTIRDLWKGKPSANVSTYVVWSITTFLTLLYAMLIVQDLLFSFVIGLQLAACGGVLVLRVRLKWQQSQRGFRARMR